MKLTIYMFDEGVTEFEEALLDRKLLGDSAFEEIPLRDSVSFDARVYLQAEHETVPKWLKFFEPHLELAEPDRLRNVHNSLLLLLRVRDHVFAISQGYGFTAIDRDKLEQGFGLRTTLNAIDPDKIKCCDVRNIDLVTRQKRTLLNHESQLVDFDIDLDQDLIRFVSGQPQNKDVGRLMQGSDSLSWSGEVEFLQLASKCEELLSLYERDTYKESFPFIDHLREVRDPELLSALYAKLQEAIDRRESGKLMLAYPELIRWDLVDSFRIYQGGTSTQVGEMHINSVYGFSDEHGIDPIDPEKIKIVPLDDDGNAIGPVQTLADYIVFEAQYQGQTNVLTLKQWYRVSDDYLADVDEAIRAIPAPDGLNLPDIQEGEREDCYNQRCAEADPDLALLDKRNIMIQGYGRIEACDLLSRSAQFIHVKRQAASATLSHLFAQGSVSFRLLANHSDYRTQILSRVADRGWDMPFSASDINQRGNLCCVYVVTTQAPGHIADCIPFFSKVNLRTHKEIIEAMGFRVAACTVRVV